MFVSCYGKAERVPGGICQYGVRGRQDLSSKMSLEVMSGKVYLVDELALHRSLRHPSMRRHLGSAVRFMVPLVDILDENDRDILVNGKDDLVGQRRSGIRSDVRLDPDSMVGRFGLP